MTDEADFPRPVSDPEAEGLPGPADQDSTADPDPDSPRIADGPDPAPLPSDAPVGLDHFGTTPEEARRGEPLEVKLEREEPEQPRTGPLSLGDLAEPPVRPDRHTPVQDLEPEE